MFYLAIESSCDETSLAILSFDPCFSLDFYTTINSVQVISSIISSQIETHAQYGGVVPEVGARLHAEQIHSLYNIILQEALVKLKLDEREFYAKLETVFVTAEPGLMSALRVGIEFAKSLVFNIEKKFDSVVELQKVNHLQGHIASSFLNFGNADSPNEYSDEQIFPHLHLMISGGNTQIRLLRSWTDWEIVGQTIDDAAGECFDKTARMVGIPYPGGATLSKIAGNEYVNPLQLPIGMLQSKNLNISLSGLKTAVRYKVQNSLIDGVVLDQPLTIQEIDLLISGIELNDKLKFVKEICISTQFAIVEQISKKMDKAIIQFQPVSVGISGGVSANKVLTKKIQDLLDTQNSNAKSVFSPELSLTGDNAIMIGLAGILDDYYKLKLGFDR